jgi:hypothetical protein
VLDAIVKGFATKEIAEDLCLSVRTRSSLRAHAAPARGAPAYGHNPTCSDSKSLRYTRVPRLAVTRIKAGAVGSRAKIAPCGSSCPAQSRPRPHRAGRQLRRDDHGSPEIEVPRVPTCWCYSTEPDMRRAEVHFLWPACSGSVARAIVRGTQVAAALDHADGGSLSPNCPNLPWPAAVLRC